MRRLLCSGAILGAVLAALLPARPGLAWGPDAHRTIALIADRILQQSDAAIRGKVEALLKTDKESPLTKNDIASEATWPDVLRDKTAQPPIATSAWHAVRFNPATPNLANA